MKRKNNEYEFDSEFEDNVSDKNISETDFKKFKLLMEESMEEVLLKYGLIRKNEILKPRMVPMRVLCNELGVSRQTINNWSKHRYFKLLVIPNRKCLGRNFVFDVEGLRRSILREGPSFGLRHTEMEKIKGNPYYLQKVKK